MTLGMGESKQVGASAIAALTLGEVVGYGQIEVTGSHGDLTHCVAINAEDDADHFAVQANLGVLSEKAHSQPRMFPLCSIPRTEILKRGAVNPDSPGIPNNFADVSPAVAIRFNGGGA